MFHFLNKFEQFSAMKLMQPMISTFFLVCLFYLTSFPEILLHFQRGLTIGIQIYFTHPGSWNSRLNLVIC